MASTSVRGFLRGGSGVFTCQICGKKTRRVMNTSLNDEICACCIEIGEQENYHADNCDNWRTVTAENCAECGPAIAAIKKRYGRA